MKRRNPDKKLVELILDLDQKIPSKKTLVAGSTEFVNEYSTKHLLRLFRVLLMRLMPEQAENLFGLFLGALSPSSIEKLAVFYGFDMERWLTLENACKWDRLFKRKGKV
ncbi:MAG: hypothetical protein QNJ81_06785 [Acidimicrobiia bacterium]|nr:hypothetical protein [Acidimicrobiia bacterium]